MNIGTKVRRFFLLDRKTKLLFLEAFIYLGWARLVICLPFSKIAPSLGACMHETSYTLSQTNKALLDHVSHAISVVSRHTFWESKCLVRAIAGMKMLERRHIESTLYLGTCKDETGKMIAHAWLRSGPCYITGADVMDGFTVVGKFAKTISEDRTGGEFDVKRF
jgi:hypothetical protein